MTDMKSHMGFRLAPRLMTLDDLELHKFEFSVNFSGFRTDFGRNSSSTGANELVFATVKLMIFLLYVLQLISNYLTES